MHQLGKLTKNFVVLDSCNDNKRLSILFFSIAYHYQQGGIAR